MKAVVFVHMCLPVTKSRLDEVVQQSIMKLYDWLQIQSELMQIS